MLDTTDGREQVEKNFQLTEVSQAETDSLESCLKTEINPVFRTLVSLLDKLIPEKNAKEL